MLHKWRQCMRLQLPFFPTASYSCPRLGTPLFSPTSILCHSFFIILLSLLFSPGYLFSSLHPSLQYLSLLLTGSGVSVWPPFWPQKIQWSWEVTKERLLLCQLNHWKGVENQHWSGLLPEWGLGHGMQEFHLAHWFRATLGQLIDFCLSFSI